MARVNCNRQRVRTIIITTQHVKHDAKETENRCSTYIEARNDRISCVCGQLPNLPLQPTRVYVCGLCKRCTNMAASTATANPAAATARHRKCLEGIRLGDGAALLKLWDDAYTSSCSPSKDAASSERNSKAEKSVPFRSRSCRQSKSSSEGRARPAPKS